MVFPPFGNSSSIYLPSVVGLVSNLSPKFHIPSLVVSLTALVGGSLPGGGRGFVSLEGRVIC